VYKKFMGLALSSLLGAFISASCNAGQLALVIDDIGYHQRDMEVLSFPDGVSYAILPHTPFAERFSQQASQLNKELLLHVPMQAESGNALGPSALTDNMTKEAVRQTLEQALNDYPNIVGVNNHMGSYLTQQIVPMSWTMELLKERDLFFLDSKTTPKSQAQNMANLFGVRNVARHVFIDNIPSEKQMRFRLMQAIRIAEKNGNAVAIAHPYPETIEFLKQELPKLAEKGITLVPVSSLVASDEIRFALLDEKTSD
jgi:polysaccharide deacetylase 2 family uncharacterized protein YibQ